MSDASGLTVYGYDGRGQLRTKQTPYGTLSYADYPNGSLKQMWSSNANGVNTSYAYDALNRLETVTDPNLGNTTYTYDEVGNLKQVAYPNAIKHEYTYNALNRLELLIDRSPTNTIINCWKYRATGAGQRTWVEEFDKRTAWYTYDNLGRLKIEAVTASIKDGKNGTVTYGYDNVGNRLTRSSSLSGVTNQAFGYDWNDRLNGDQYDNNGNTKSAPVSQPPGTPEPGVGGSTIRGTDDYDSENRLVQRTGTSGSNVTLVYDGDGNRVSEIVNGQVKNYLVDDRNPTGHAQVVEEIGNGVVNHTYTYGHDLISQDQFDSLAGNWRASFYGYDGRGTVRFLTDETGAVTDTYTYDAFGTLITATGSTNNRYLYSGEQFDPNLGLYYLRARLMNPLSGRFWTMDGYEGNGSDPITLHKYLYGNSDPTNHTDPTGNSSLGEVMVNAAIGATIGALTAVNVTAYLNPNATEEDLWAAAGNGALTGALGGVGFGVRSASTFIQAIRILTAAGLSLNSGLEAIQAEGERERNVYAAAAVLGLWGTASATRTVAAGSSGGVATQLEFEFVRGNLSGSLSNWGGGASLTQTLRVTTQQLQRKFKHAPDFGVDGDYNLTNASRYGAAINEHINSRSVNVIQGQYRGAPVTHYVDPATRLNVIADPAGNFISGWRLSSQQLEHVLKTGNLGGG